MKRSRCRPPPRWDLHAGESNIPETESLTETAPHLRGSANVRCYRHWASRIILRRGGSGVPCAHEISRREHI